MPTSRSENAACCENGCAVKLSGPIFLIGLPGVGKTTLGRAVEARTGVRFVDLDEAVEADAGMTVSEIFAAEGEGGFRRRERKQLERYADVAAVVACGGGTPCEAGNMELMNGSGTTVWLQAPMPLLAERIIQQEGQRPMFCCAPEEVLVRLEALAERRRGFYSRATHVFDASALDDEQGIRSSVERFLETFLH